MKVHVAKIANAGFVYFSCNVSYTFILTSNMKESICLFIFASTFKSFNQLSIKSE